MKRIIDSTIAREDGSLDPNTRRVNGFKGPRPSISLNEKLATFTIIPKNPALALEYYEDRLKLLKQGAKDPSKREFYGPFIVNCVQNINSLKRRLS